MRLPLTYSLLASAFATTAEPTVSIAHEGESSATNAGQILVSTSASDGKLDLAAYKPSGNRAPRPITLIPVPFQAPTPEYTKPQRIVVLLAEGFDPIEVTFSRPQIVNPPYEIAGRLVDQYEALALAARGGDGAAARMLFLELKSCEYIAAHDGHYSDQTRARCEGLTDQHRDNYGDWAKIAARSGDYLGTQYWGMQLGVTPEAVEVFESFWDSGNASALPALSGLHSKGASTGAPDWRRAYAYHLIYLKLDEALRAAGRSSRAAGKNAAGHPALSEHLIKLSSMLTSGQQKEAEELAYRLLVENTKCCRGGF